MLRRPYKVDIGGFIKRDYRAERALQSRLRASGVVNLDLDEVDEENLDQEQYPSKQTTAQSVRGSKKYGLFNRPLEKLTPFLRDIVREAKSFFARKVIKMFEADLQTPAAVGYLPPTTVCADPSTASSMSESSSITNRLTEFLEEQKQVIREAEERKTSLMNQSFRSISSHHTAPVARDHNNMITSQTWQFAESTRSLQNQSTTSAQRTQAIIAAENAKKLKTSQQLLSGLLPLNKSQSLRFNAINHLYNNESEGENEQAKKQFEESHGAVSNEANRKRKESLKMLPLTPSPVELPKSTTPAQIPPTKIIKQQSLPQQQLPLGSRNILLRTVARLAKKSVTGSLHHQNGDDSVAHHLSRKKLMHVVRVRKFQAEDDEDRQSQGESIGEMHSTLLLQDPDVVLSRESSLIQHSHLQQSKHKKLSQEIPRKQSKQHQKSQENTLLINNRNTAAIAAILEEQNNEHSQLDLNSVTSLSEQCDDSSFHSSSSMSLKNGRLGGLRTNLNEEENNKLPFDEEFSISSIHHQIQRSRRDEETDEADEVEQREIIRLIPAQSTATIAPSLLTVVATATVSAEFKKPLEKKPTEPVEVNEQQQTVVAVAQTITTSNNQLTEQEQTIDQAKKVILPAAPEPATTTTPAAPEPATTTTPAQIILPALTQPVTVNQTSLPKLIEESALPASTTPSPAPKQQQPISLGSSLFSALNPSSSSSSGLFSNLSSKKTEQSGLFAGLQGGKATPATSSGLFSATQKDVSLSAPAAAITSGSMAEEEKKVEVTPSVPSTASIFGVSTNPFAAIAATAPPPTSAITSAAAVAPLDQTTMISTATNPFNSLSTVTAANTSAATPSSNPFGVVLQSPFGMQSPFSANNPFSSSTSNNNGSNNDSANSGSNNNARQLMSLSDLISAKQQNFNFSVQPTQSAPLIGGGGANSSSTGISNSLFVSNPNNTSLFFTQPQQNSAPQQLSMFNPIANHHTPAPQPQQQQTWVNPNDMGSSQFMYGQNSSVSTQFNSVVQPPSSSLQQNNVSSLFNPNTNSQLFASTSNNNYLQSQQQPQNQSFLNMPPSNLQPQHNAFSTPIGNDLNTGGFYNNNQMTSLGQGGFNMTVAPNPFQNQQQLNNSFGMASSNLSQQQPSNMMNNSSLFGTAAPSTLNSTTTSSSNNQKKAKGKARIY